MAYGLKASSCNPLNHYLDFLRSKGLLPGLIAAYIVWCNPKSSNSHLHRVCNFRTLTYGLNLNTDDQYNQLKRFKVRALLTELKRTTKTYFGRNFVIFVCYFQHCVTTYLFYNFTILFSITQKFNYNIYFLGKSEQFSLSYSYKYGFLKHRYPNPITSYQIQRYFKAT